MWIHRDPKGDGHEWIDSSSFSLLRKIVEARAATIKREIPGRDAANPVQRIVPCKLTTEE